jgi:hypothetical protein
MEVKFDTAFNVRNTAHAAAVRGTHTSADSVTLSTTHSLRGALSAEAELRPDEVARARELFLSPSYPAEALVHKLSNLLASEWPKPGSLD